MFQLGRKIDDRFRIPLTGPKFEGSVGWEFFFYLSIAPISVPLPRCKQIIKKEKGKKKFQDLAKIGSVRHFFLGLILLISCLYSVLLILVNKSLFLVNKIIGMWNQMTTLLCIPCSIECCKHPASASKTPRKWGKVGQMTKSPFASPRRTKEAIDMEIKGNKLTPYISGQWTCRPMLF